MEVIQLFKNLTINSIFGKYNVHFKKSKIKFKNDKNFLYVIDKNIYKYYIRNFKHISKILIVDAKESNKSFEKMNKYLSFFQKNKVNKKTIVTCIGGGITQDITSFICSIYYRGIKWHFYPTTLLAQADSCIGSKNSINFNKSKNLIGCFYPPEKVVINTNFLKTLKDKEITSGIGEILKCGIISNSETFLKNKNQYLKLINYKRNLELFIYKSLQIKKKIIEMDEFDKKERKIMNYGHTFGHALESECNYKIPHGIAVNIGMDLANYLSMRYNFINQGKYIKLNSILVENFEKFKNYKPNIRSLCNYLNNDKKNTKKNFINAILLKNKKLRITSIKLDNHFKSYLDDYFSG